jgi:hypothetical protein
MGATSRRSKGRPVRSVSRSSEYDDTADGDASYEPKNTRHPARRARRRSHNDNDRQAFYSGERESDNHHMHIVDAVSLVWRTLSNLFRIIVTCLQHWTTYLPRPVTAILMLIAGCIILSLLTDFTVNSAYAIACQTPNSWIHWTGLPWHFEPVEACRSLGQDPYEAIWDNPTGATALLNIGETSQQLQRAGDAS